MGDRDERDITTDDGEKSNVGRGKSETTGIIHQPGEDFNSPNPPPETGMTKAGPAWRDIASSAYRAYSASTGNKNFRGDAMPKWDELPQPIRTAWEAAARQVGNVLSGGSFGLDIEQRWHGWIPPRMREA